MANRAQPAQPQHSDIRNPTNLCVETKRGFPNLEGKPRQFVRNQCGPNYLASPAGALGADSLLISFVKRDLSRDALFA